MKLQQEYLETGKQSVLGLMFRLLFVLEKKMIRAQARRSGFFISADELEDKADEAALFIIMRYKKPGFKIQKLGAYAGFGMRKALHGHSRTEMRRKDVLNRALKTVSADSLAVMEDGTPDIFEGASFVISGVVPSKKNSRINTGSGKSFPSERFTEWHRRCTSELFPQRAGLKTISQPVSLSVRFTHADARRRDSDNMLSSVLDLLVDCRILLDDDWKIVRRISVVNVQGGEPSCRIEIRPED